MQRELIGFIFLVAILIFALIASFSTIVAFDCGVGCSFSSADEPYLEGWGLLIGVYAVLFPQLDPVRRANQDVSLWRRTVALVIDFHVVMVSAGATVAIMLRLALFVLTQSWNWSEHNPSSQMIAPMNTAALFCVFAIIFMYFWLFSLKGRATVGQYIMGFQIISETDRPRFWLRPLVGYISIASIPLWILFDSKGANDGRYWWDRVSGTRPIMLAV